MAYICCNDYLLLIGLCKTVEEGNYKGIIRLNEIIGWKYEKSEKAFTLLLRINLWVYVSFLSLFYDYSLLYRIMI